MRPAKESVTGHQSNSLEITGRKFHRLTAIKPVGRNRDRAIVWEFKCDCGALTNISATRVIRGLSKSCGCQTIDSAKALAPLQLVGLRFGRLCVVSRNGSNKHRSALWLCRCDCGNTVTVPSASLTKGVTQSCGCRKIELLVATARRRRLSDSGMKKRQERRRKQAREAARIRRLDPVFRVTKSISFCLMFALKRLNQNKTASTFKLLPYTPQELKIHLERQFTRGMSWENYGEWQIDHIVPVCEAATTDDVLKLNALSNLRPLRKLDNMRKNGRRTLLC